MRTLRAGRAGLSGHPGSGRGLCDDARVSVPPVPSGPSGPPAPWTEPGGGERTAGARLRLPNRMIGVDAARALALLGMVATHVLPLADDGTATPTALLAAGRASALFAVLAGVSLGLAHGGRRPPAGRDLSRARAGVAARAAVVAAVGLVLGGFGPPIAIILVNYALLFVVALPVLGWGARRLVPLGAVWLVVVPVLAFPLRRALTGGGTGGTDGVAVDGVLPIWPGSSPDLLSLADPGLLLGQLTVTGYYPVLTWAGFLLVGLGLGRLDLRRPVVAARVAVAGALAVALAQLVAAVLRPAAEGSLAVPTGFPLSADTLDLSLQTGLYGTTPTTSWWWLAVIAPHSGTPLDMVDVAGSALAVLGVLLLVEHASRHLLWPLAAIGSMTLTLYSAHAISLVALEPWIEGDPSTGTGPADALVVYVVQVAAVVVVALGWQLTGRRGPLEGMVASASRAARDAVRA